MESVQYTHDLSERLINVNLALLLQDKEQEKYAAELVLANAELILTYMFIIK